MTPYTHVMRICEMLISYVRLDHTLYSINYGKKLFIGEDCERASNSCSSPGADSQQSEAFEKKSEAGIGATVATITPTCESPDSNRLEPPVASGAGLTVNDREGELHVRDHGAAGSPYSSPGWGDRYGGCVHGSPAGARDGQRRRGKGRNRVIAVRNGCFTWTRGDGERALRDPRDGDGDGGGGDVGEGKREGEREERNKIASSNADSAEGLSAPVEWTLSDLNFTIYSVRLSTDGRKVVNCNLVL